MIATPRRGPGRNCALFWRLGSALRASRPPIGAGLARVTIRIIRRARGTGESCLSPIEGALMLRREFLLGAAASVAACSPSAVLAAEGPPLSSKGAFVAWMTANRPAEEPRYLERRWDRYQVLLSFHDLWTPADKRAFLMTPRQEFVLPEDKENAYVGHYLDIGFGVTITPPGTMGRMTSALDIRGSDKVLEIGTGSGFQSALLTYLTPHVHSIEIIPELASRTRGVYDRLIGAGYREYGAIETRSGDGYYGWPEAAP